VTSRKRADSSQLLAIRFLAQSRFSTPRSSSLPNSIPPPKFARNRSSTHIFQHKPPFPSHTVSPYPNNTHRKPDTADQTPDPLHPPFPRHLHLNLLSIHFVHLHIARFLSISSQTREAREAVVPILHALSAKERHQRRPQQVRVLTPRRGERVCCDERQRRDGCECQDLAGRASLDVGEREGSFGGGGKKGEGGERYCC